MDVAAVKVYSVARSTIKSTSQVVGLRDRVAIIRAMLHAISSTQPYAGYGDLSGVGRVDVVNVLSCFLVGLLLATSNYPLNLAFTLRYDNIIFLIFTIALLDRTSRFMNRDGKYLTFL